MAMISTDWTITRATGAIRYVGDDHGGASPSYATVIQFHRWLQDFADQEVSSGDDELDITDSTPSSRSTDNIITLLGSYNIDDNAAEHLFDGSIIQGTGGTEEFYDGIVNFGNTDVQIQLIQNGAVLSDDWWNFSGGGLNANATQGISHRFMVKTRTSGADIDNRALIGTSRTYGNTYSEFKINSTARGNNVLALTDSSDLNNATAEATVAGYTGVTNLTEGYANIDVDNNGADEFYYSEWNTNQPTRSINDYYERMKWISKDPIAEDSNATSDSSFAVGNATITGQAQSFSVGSNAVLIPKVILYLNANGSPTGNAVAKLYAHTGVFGTSSVPSGAALATSDNFDVSTLDATSRPVVFNFSTQIELSASTNYCVSVEYVGDASNFIELSGNSTSSHGGNRSEEIGTWSASATSDLKFSVYGTIDNYGLPGNLFRGITHQIAISAGAGTWVEPESLSWGAGATAGTGQLLAVDNTTSASATKLWMQLLTGVVPNANTITGNGGATATAGTVTERAVSTPFVGASTGSAIIGAYGLGIDKDDLNATDKVFDLDNTQVTPPNNVTFTVFGVVNTQDRILVTNDNTGIDFTQMALAVALTGGAETIVDVGTGNIPADTPATGNIRIELDDGRYRLVPYLSHDGDDEFTIASTDFTGAGNGAAIANNVFLAYIDKLAAGTSEAFTTVYDADRTLFVRVRDGGASPIKTFETTGVLGTNGGSVTAIRTSDE